MITSTLRSNEGSYFILSTSNMLNPATLLPTPKTKQQVLYMNDRGSSITPSPFPHIHNSPLFSTTDTWFIDGSSANTLLKKRVVYFIVNGSKAMEANPLPPVLPHKGQNSLP